MNHNKKLLYKAALSVTVLIGVSFLIPGQPQAKAQDATFNNIAPPDEKGPYNVGIKKFDNVPMTPAVPGGAPRPATLQVFYPTSDAKNCQTKYTIVDAGGQGGSYQISSPLCAVQDANPAPGPFPLIVYDHGGGSPGVDNARALQLPVHETLASHGFVVVAALHAPTARQRVLDVPLIIDYMLGTGNPHYPHSASIDPLRIGISGVSTGGRTSLAVTGGWAAQGIDADSRVKAMVLYEPGRDNSLDDVATISIPLLVMGGNRFVNGVVTVPEVFDATVLATPRIRVLNPEALHTGYDSNRCAIIDETREAAFDSSQGGDPNQLEPLVNMVPFTPCQIDPNTGVCRRVCNSAMGVAAFRACAFWNNGETAFPANGFAFGGGRNVCNRVGVNSSRSLDVLPDGNPPGDGFTDSVLGDISLFEPNDLWDNPFSSLEPPMTGEVLTSMMKLYTVAFFKKFLEGDGRYMRYLTPGYANTHNLEAVVEIRE